MKYLLFLLFTFTALSTQAQCLVTPQPLSPEGWGSVTPNATGYVRFCQSALYQGPFAGCASTSPWVPYDYHTTPVLTNDTLETCDGFWLPTAEEVRSGTGSNPPSSSGDVVTAIEDSTLVLTTAIACLCFFTGLNSWETSAK